MSLRASPSDDPTVDPADFEALYRAHAAYVWAVLRRLGVEAVADAHQEVFITAYRRRDSFEAGRPVRPWLVGIARKVAFRARRSRSRRTRKRHALTEAGRAAARRPHEVRDRIEARDFIERFIERLPPVRREIFVRGELEGRTGREIAQSLDLGLDAVYGQLRAARRQLKTELMAVEAPPMSRERIQRGFALLGPYLRSSAAPTGTAPLASIASSTVTVATTLVLAGLVATASLTEPTSPAAETTSSAATSPEARPRPSTPSTPEASLLPPPVPGTSAPLEPETIEPDDRTLRPRPAPLPAEDSPEPSEPTRRLSEARRALLEGRADAALTLLHEHARDFPDTALEELRDALRVEVLCALGRGAQARGEARVLLRRHPSSNVARHAATVCPDD